MAHDLETDSLREGPDEADRKIRVPTRGSRRMRSRAGRFICRRSQRLAMDEMLSRASLLPAKPRIIFQAYYELKMPSDELALLHGIPAWQLRKRLCRWRELLADPDFLLAARFAAELPGPLARLAADYWVEGRSLRELASERGATVHRIRERIAEARLQLSHVAAAAALACGRC